MTISISALNEVLGLQLFSHKLLLESIDSRISGIVLVALHSIVKVKWQNMTLGLQNGFSLRGLVLKEKVLVVLTLVCYLLACQCFTLFQFR
jgi:hypothetical protein